MIRELAIVLGSMPYQERNRLVYLLTENHGKLSGIAKGAIHSRRFGASFDLFNCIQVQYREKSSQNLITLQEAQVYYGFPKLRESLETITTASYFLDLCKRVTEGHAPTREIFLFLTNYLYLLEQVYPSPEITRSFEFKLLQCLGCTPIIDYCIVCNTSPQFDPLKQNSENKLYLSIDHGGILCSNCYNNQKYSLAISKESLAWMRKIKTTRIRELKNISSLSDKHLKEMDFLLYYIQHHCNNLNVREMPSYTMMKKLLPYAQKKNTTTNV